MLTRPFWRWWRSGRCHGAIGSVLWLILPTPGWGIEPVITHVGTATVIIEIGGLRLVTDPALDPAGTTHGFALGTKSTITLDPTHASTDFGPIDAVLLSHDQHLDNLDLEGRRLVQRDDVARVLTTRPAQRRLGRELGIEAKLTGLRPWQSAVLEGDDGFALSITAVPARHGVSQHLPGVGKVIGFVVEWSEDAGVIYISGDTVMFPGIRRIARRYEGRIDWALLHCGAAQFPTASWVVRGFRFTMNAEEATRATATLSPDRVSPIHYDGWTHFVEPADDLFEALGGAVGDTLWRLERAPSTVP